MKYLKKVIQLYKSIVERVIFWKESFIEKIVSVLDCFLKRISFWKNKLQKEYTDNTNFSSLSPIDDVDKKQYEKALFWALKNRKSKDIKNIALSGNYGSGKSSILKSFQKNYKGYDLKFLNISLATFKEEKVTKANGKNENTGKELLRLIELSILQQIFYHEKDEKIPDSRFNKIKSYSKFRLFVYSVAVFIFLSSITTLIFPDFVYSFFSNNMILESNKSIIRNISLIITLLGLFYAIYKSIRLVKSLTISKLKFHDAEIEIDKNISKSILNQHLDEILYFFTVLPYNVVIVEDLDRFEDTEIFTKLREINLLLNNSKKTINKNIVFIYAIRDEMFTDKERTKFFDFIIPVIPTINSSNSSEILLRKNSNNNYGLSQSFIEDIAFIIDDMRLLHNICNEFSLYRETLPKSLIAEKLFSIISFKNLYPSDFALLQQDKGILYETIRTSKRKILTKAIEQIDKQIILHKEEIKKFDEVFEPHIKNIRKLYILEIITSLPNFQGFLINGKQISVNDLAKDENFVYCMDNKLQYQSTSYYHGEQTKNIEVPFSEIEKRVNSQKSYNQTSSEITDLQSGKINRLRDDINTLNNQKTALRNSKIKELIKESETELEFDFSTSKLEENDQVTYKNILTIFIKNGYITEDYLDYISIFHEESISRQDNQFLICIKNQNKLDFNFQLSKIENLIPKINELDYSSEYILNYNLFDFLIANESKYQTQINSIFSKLKDESAISIKFIKNFSGITEKPYEFINLLAKYWNNLWRFFENDNTWEEEKKHELFILILTCVDIELIPKLSTNSSFLRKILNDKNFLTIIEDETRIIELIKALSIKFENIDFKHSPSDIIITFLYENNHYRLNPYMISSIMSHFDKLDRALFENSNYSSINQSGLDNLLEYVNDNINTYLEELYFKIPTNTNEEEVFLIELLNNSDILDKKKQLLINFTNTKINKVEDVENTNLLSSLMKDNICPTWENLFYLYATFETVTDEIIQFINNSENTQQLSQHKVPLKKGEGDSYIYLSFWKEILTSDSIDIDNYRQILKSNPWIMPSLELSGISDNKVVALIDSEVIKTTIELFDILNENHPNTIINLVEKNRELYLNSDIVLNSSNLNQILKSSVLTDNEKEIYLSKCPVINATSSEENSKLILNIFKNNTNFKISDDIATSILINERLSSKDRIILFNHKSNLITNISQFIDTLSPEYKEINNFDRKALIENNGINKTFLGILINRQYISSYSERDKGLRINHKTNRD